MPNKTRAGSTRQESVKIQDGPWSSSARAEEPLKRRGFVCYGAFKRGADFLLATVMIVVLAPLFLVVAVAIKIDSPGPVFFKQLRTGKNGKPFYMYKFRSMVADNDVFDASCGDKYTRIGGGLRKTSIDELPQLINIVRGEMCIIGPRPWVVEYYNNMTERERNRYAVRPGITGLAAAKGRNELSIFEKINYDLEYVKNYGLKQDVKIVLWTIKTVVTHEGASSNKEAIRDELTSLKCHKRGQMIVAANRV